MRFKIFVLLVLLVPICLADTFYSSAAQPEVNTKLALEQFSNPTTETDSLGRNLNKLDPFPWLYGGWFALSTLVLWSDGKRIIKGLVK